MADFVQKPLGLCVIADQDPRVPGLVKGVVALDFEHGLRIAVDVDAIRNGARSADSVQIRALSTHRGKQMAGFLEAIKAEEARAEELKKEAERKARKDASES